jgi:DNA-binding MarR family transcriptional regulator
VCLAEDLGRQVVRRPEQHHPSVVVELTQKGRETWDASANVQGRREAFFARTLTKAEQKQLNTPLRKLLLGLDAALEASSPTK